MASQQPADSASTRFFTDIERGGLPPGVTAVTATTAVLCPFLLRITLGEVRDLLAALPPTLRAILEGCAARKGERAAVFDGEQFLRMVRYRVPGLSVEQADDMVRAVLAALQQVLPADAQHDLASQLPKDLKALWPARRRAA